MRLLKQQERQRQGQQQRIALHVSLILLITACPLNGFQINRPLTSLSSRLLSFKKANHERTTTTWETMTSSSTKLFSSSSSSSSSSAFDSSSSSVLGGGSSSSSPFLAPTTLNGEEDYFMASLRARIKEVKSKDEALRSKWRNSECQSTIGVTCPDWIRRVDASQYPIACCGSSSGHLFLCHLETNQVLAQTPCPPRTRSIISSSTKLQTRQELIQRQSLSPSTTSTSNKDISEQDKQRDEQVLNELFSGFDGGGTLALAMDSTTICVANRDGGVEIFDYIVHNVHSSSPKARLEYRGSMRALENRLVTALQLVGNQLWVATADGRLEAHNLGIHHQGEDEDDYEILYNQRPSLSWETGSPILSLSIQPHLGYGCITTSNRSVCLFSLYDDDGFVAEWKPPLDKAGTTNKNNDDDNNNNNKQDSLLSATIVQCKQRNDNDNSSSPRLFGNDNRDDGDTSVLLVAGSSSGCIHLKPLNWRYSRLDIDSPLKKSLHVSLQPRHGGPVKCLASPFPGLLLSGGQDGSIRVWDVASEHDTYFLYQFVGYKVWLSSIWTDGSRVISDGVDNAIIVHDFTTNNNNNNNNNDSNNKKKNNNKDT